MHEVALPGVDGTNPLAFLAALGVLEAVRQHSADMHIRWRDEGGWYPVLSSGYDNVDALVERLDSDRRDCLSEPALALSYGGKRDLKPLPRDFRVYLERLVDNSTPAARRSVDWASAFATDVATDNNGNIKPTALHFTAGQQQFLQMALELARGVTTDDFREALVGPWLYSRDLPIFGWDSTSSRDYALRATDPSIDKKLGVPGADWLACRGLMFLPTVPRGVRVLTTGCEGGWKDGRFRWPLWTVPLPAAVIRTVLRLDVRGMPTTERTARGIGAVFESAIRRHDQGGRGSFGPASVS